MTEPAADLARRDDARLSTLERVFGTGDMVQMIAATRDNVNAAIAFAREREYVSEYPIERNGRRVGTRLWFHHPTWQLLGQSFGITAYTEGEPTEVKPGTWQAAAIAATIETGQVVGRAVGLAAKTEPGKQHMADHHLSAIAQARAQRNALRSCLGAVLIAAGFEISDPGAPLTNEQLGLLHQLEREIGFDHDEGHAMAGVESYTQLNRDQASDIIDAWQAMRDEIQGGGTATSPTSDTAGATNPRPEPSATLGEVVADQEGSPGGPEGEAVTHPGDSSPPPSATAPASTEAWERAARAGVTAAKAKAIAKGLGFTVKSAADLTGEQLAKVVAAVKDSA